MKHVIFEYETDNIKPLIVIEIYREIIHDFISIYLPCVIKAKDPLIKHKINNISYECNKI